MARQHNNPYIVKDDTAHALVPAAFNYDEAWLRDFIFAHQQVLPVNEIEPVFGSLIPVCIELRTKAGPADILFINDAGLVTLVECKLWKNPESRREVVGQILDYAKELSRWSYQDLQKALRDSKGRSLYELVSENSEELDEAGFIDNVTRNLRRGRFLLLVVGNGIRESVEQIADFLQQHAHLNFSFALVEIGVFQLPEEIGGGHLIHPRLVIRTVEIERAVIRIEDAQVISEMPSAAVASRLSTSAPGKRTTISEQTFYEQLDLNTAAGLRDFVNQARAKGLGLDIEPGKNSLKLKLAIGNTEFNFGTFRQNGIFRNYGIALWTEEIGHPEIGEEYLDKLATLFADGHVDKSGSKFQWTVKRENNQYATITDALAVQNSWLDLIVETAEKLTKALE